MFYPTEFVKLVKSWLLHENKSVHLTAARREISKTKDVPETLIATT